MSTYVARGKEWHPIEDAVRAAGWSITKTANGHLKLVAPSGRVIYCGSNRSDWRAAKNAAAMLRREGVSI